MWRMNKFFIENNKYWFWNNDQTMSKLMASLVKDEVFVTAKKSALKHKNHTSSTRPSHLLGTKFLGWLFYCTYISTTYAIGKWLEGPQSIQIKKFCVFPFLFNCFLISFICTGCWQYSQQWIGIVAVTKKSRRHQLFLR